MANTFVKDVTIIGAGPVGLFGIFECGMVGLSCNVVDILPHAGGQCAALYPDKPIYDIPAHPCVTGQELIDHLVQQAAPFDPYFHLSQQASSFQDTEDGFILNTSAGHTLRSRAIIIAAGMGAFAPKKPPLQNIEAFEEKSVFYHVRDPQRFTGKHILIAGGGDSAVDWALILADIAQSITIVHRRSKLRCAPENERRLNEAIKEGKITMAVPYQLGSLHGDIASGSLKEVTLYDLDGQEKTIECDILLPFFGLSNDLGPLATWDLQRTQGRIKVDPMTCVTSIPGIYAIGDVAGYEHKLKLILTGFAEAAQAAHAIRAYLNPGQVFHFEYSTTSGVPGHSH